MATRDNETGANASGALPSRRSLRQTAPQPDASDAVLSELQRQVTEVKAHPGAGTGELRRDRSRLRGSSTESGETHVQSWVDRSPLDSVETTTTAAISLPPVVLPPVLPPPTPETAHILAPSTEQFSTVTVRELGQARGRKPASSTTKSTASSTRRRRGFAARMVTLTAMVFVGMMAIATSIPANALLSAEDVAAMAQAQQSGGVVTADVDGQSIVASGIEGSVGRDNVSVTSGFQLTMRHTDLSYVNNPMSNIQWPFHVTVPIADGFGYRVAPCDGCSTDHKGVDFDPGQGAPIMAVADGTVTQVVEGWGGLGYYVVLSHNVNGLAFESWYGHMYQGSITVSVGQTVKLGEILGQVGDTGMSTGPHLHLEIHVNNEPVDPFAFLTAHNI